MHELLMMSIRRIDMMRFNRYHRGMMASIRTRIASATSQRYRVAYHNRVAHIR
jgi:hypothetical protein